MISRWMKFKLWIERVRLWDRVCERPWEREGRVFCHWLMCIKGMEWFATGRRLSTSKTWERARLLSPKIADPPTLLPAIDRSTQKLMVHTHTPSKFCVLPWCGNPTPSDPLSLPFTCSPRRIFNWRRRCATAWNTNGVSAKECTFTSLSHHSPVSRHFHIALTSLSGLTPLSHRSHTTLRSHATLTSLSHHSPVSRHFHIAGVSGYRN